VSSSTITTVASSVLSATSVNTANTIVKRDGSGGFAGGAITATSLTSSGNISSTTINTGTLTATSLVTNTLKVTAGSYTTSNAVLTSDGAGNAVWSTNGLYTLNGISASAQTFSTTTASTSTTPSFTSTGTVHTLNIPSASVSGTIAGLISNSEYNTIATPINSATSSNTANTLVKRDGSGGFAAGIITATSLASSGNISSTSLNTGTITATSLTLTTPLSIASGGTGTNTATGTGSVVLSTSPALTGTPTAVTAAPGTNTDQIATTAFVTAAVAAGGGGSTYTTGSNSSLGGYVFYVTPDGKHGLVAETFEFDSPLYNANDKLKDPTNHSTAGKNFMDWRVPTLYELNLMYAKKVELNMDNLIDAESHYYTFWTSTKDLTFYQNYNAKIFDSSGALYDHGITVNNWIRAVRSF